jgi:hypothetical protein
MGRWLPWLGIGFVALALSSSSMAQAQANATNLGTWRLNVAKSKNSPGQLPKSLTRTWEDRGDGSFLFTTQGINAQGNPTKGAFVFRHDGKDYPFASINVTNITTIAQRRIDAYTVELTFKVDGKVTTVATEVVSKDGKTMTFEQKGTNAQGQPIHNIQILEKQ